MECYRAHIHFLSMYTGDNSQLLQNVQVESLIYFDELRNLLLHYSSCHRMIILFTCAQVVIYWLHFQRNIFLLLVHYIICSGST